MGKDNFILYSSHRELFETLTDAQAGKLIKAIFQYEDSGKIVQLPSATNMAFIAIKSTLDANKEKYEKIVERNRENGQRGGRPKNPNNPNGFLKTQAKTQKTKKADIDNDIDIDIDIDIDNDADSINKIIKCYEENIGLLTPASSEILLSYLDTLSSEMIVQAIKIATQRNKRNARYIQGIIQDWIRKGYKTLGDLKNEAEEIKQKNKQEYEKHRYQDLEGLYDN